MDIAVAAFARATSIVGVVVFEPRALLEARGRLDYNANRPHSAHGELTPTEFALQWTTTHQPEAA